MNRLRILVPMLHYYPDRPSGSTRLAFDEARYLARQGHEVWVVAPDLTGKSPEYLFQDDLHVLRYQNPSLKSLNPQRMYIHQELSAHLVGKYLGDRVDLVHGHSLLQYAGILNLYRRRARLGYTVHSPVKLEMQATARDHSISERLVFHLKAFLTHRIERRCLQHSDYVTSDSHYTKRMLGQLHGTRLQQKVKVIPGWVDVERFKIIPDRDVAKARLGWSNDVPVLFTLRRLVPRMGLDRMLHALQKVRSVASFHMFIGGQGPLRLHLESLIEELGLEDQVHFLGFVPHDLLPLMYGAADAFVLPTAELECFGLIALESLSAGRPVLATPVGAIPEIIEQIEPAWLAADASVQAISDLVSRFLRGELPEHRPEELHAFAAANYASDTVLARLTTFAMGGVA